MVRVKIKYLYHEVAVKQFHGWSVTVLNPVTSEFSFFCFCFEVNTAMNEK